MTHEIPLLSRGRIFSSFLFILCFNVSFPYPGDVGVNWSGEIRRLKYDLPSMYEE